MTSMYSRMISALCLMALLGTTALPPKAWAEDVVQEEKVTPGIVAGGLALGKSSVSYPVLTGWPDAEIQQQVNDLLLSAGKIEQRLNRMAVLMSSPVSLTVDYTAVLENDVLSVAIRASGALETERATQEWATVNVDLRTGEAITWDDLFIDAQAAQEAISDLIADEVLPEVSAHLGAAELLPLPEVFSLSPYGLTLHYPIRRFETLAQQAGTITVLWSEIDAELNTAPEGILTRLGVMEHMTFPADARSVLTQVLSQGRFPAIPAALGEEMQTLMDTYHLMNDPDVAGSQRVISLEDGAFRGVYLLTDDLQDDFAGSVVQEIRAERLMLCGLMTGKTTREAWQAALGTPDHSVTVNQEAAEKRRLVAGQTDYYALWGNATLCLHADEEGILRTVMLMQAENEIP